MSSEEEVSFESSDADAMHNENSEEGDSDNDSEEGGSDNDNDEVETEELSGWADSMSKILKSTKPKNKKNLILSRAKKDYEVNKEAQSKKGNDIEIAKDEKNQSTKGDNNNEKQAESEEDDILSVKQQRKLELRQRKLERAWENLNRITTDKPDREMEVDLLKIATKGVVQLFNAVAQQQKTLKSKLRDSSKSEFKKDKVMSQSKDLFDKAMTKSRIIVKDNEDRSDEDGPVEVKKESSSDEESESRIKDARKRKKICATTESSSKKPMWQALQDDFMLDAKLKDWDKESDSD